MAEIAIRAVRKSYGRSEVLHGVDLEIGKGEFLVILGPSGCGKSTLLRLVAGLEQITAGTIEIDGKVVNRLEPRERGCAMVFQNYALYPHMTVAENIGYALKIARVAKAERLERVRKVAAALGLTEFLERKPADLSGGQRQRVAMGRAMIREPKVFLYDEPLSNLDARLRVAMRVEIRKLHQRLGATTMFVTHDQIEAMTLADRIVIMNKGEIQQVGTPSEVYDRPQTTFVAGFVGSPGLNLLSGIADADRSRVLFPDGQELAFDPAQWPDVGHGPVVAGFRAEAARLHGRGAVASLDFVEELGASKLLHASMAGQAVVIQGAMKEAPPPGTVLSFKVRPEDVQLFDPDTGRRLSENVRARTPGRELAQA